MSSAPVPDVSVEEDGGERRRNGVHPPTPTSSSSLANGSTRHVDDLASSSTRTEPASSFAAYDEGVRQATDMHAMKKRKKRMEDLGFSSPGPAFFSMSVSSDAGTDSDVEGRARRRLRVAAANSNGSSALHLSGTNGSGTPLSVQRSHSHASSSSMSPSPASTERGAVNRLSDPKEVPKNAPSTSTKSIFRNWMPSSANGTGRRRKVNGHGGQEGRGHQRSTDSHPTTSSSTRRDPRSRRFSSRTHGADGRSFAEADGMQNAARAPSIGEHLALSKGRSTTDPTTFNAKGKERATMDDEKVDEEMLDPQERRRRDLLHARRAELDRVYKEHDMLVRQLFHLRKFVTLIGFDPEVALQDHSDVFERFRMEYDLATLLSGTKGRATRRLVSAKRGDLALPVVEVTTTARQQAREASRATTSKIAGKQEEKAKAVQDVQDGDGRSRKHAARATESDDSSQVELGSQRKKRARKSKTELLLQQKRQLQTRSSSSASSSDEQATTPEHHPKARRGRPPKFVYEPKKPVEIERIDGIPRLRVLKPAHLPPPSQHRHSMAAYLESWHTSGELVGPGNEMEVLTSDTLQAREAREAALYMRIDELRSHGLLQSREEALKQSQRNKAREAGRSQTTWDRVLAGVGEQALLRRTELRAKTAVAKRVARMVQTYWDEKLGRGEKHRKAEERRIRALAKWTVREVRKQWKLAVNVIRAQHAAREKQEKDRVGREQLKNILERSSQMLGQQHKALLELKAQSSESEESDLDIDSDEDDDEDDEEDVSDSIDEEEDRSDEEIESGIEKGESESGALIARLDQSSDHDVSSASEDSDEGSSGSDNAFGDLSQLLLPPSPKEESGKGSAQVASLPEIDLENTVSGTESTDAFVAKDELRPVRTVSTLRSESDSADGIPLNGSVIEDTDDASVKLDGESSGTIHEDAELERQMWEEDESESDEDQEMAAEADMPIEDLMRKYGYGAEAKAGSRSDSTSSHVGDVSVTNGQEVSPRRVAEISTAEEEEVAGEEVDEDHSSAQISLRPSRSRTAASSPASESHNIKVKPPFLLRGNLRPYQQIGFEWLLNLYNSGSNGILADEMGLGKTIQTIALLGHLACDKGVWGPHLVVAPTSVMLNWEVEFKKFLPGFKILSYYGSQRERQEKRKGWNTENSFNVCITSYQLILADQHILRRKAWKYLVLDEAHHIKNFRSQRWQTLLGFNSQRRLLLTGTPLQNNLMDLWSLMYFLMPNGVVSAEGVASSGFASMKEFQQWFSNPLDRAVENAGLGTVSDEMDNETKGMVSKLHTLLRPYLLRRLKSEVEREMPNKYEHVIRCRLSKRQQFLYNDFMSRAKTRESLASGNYLSIINCLMQLRKVCNHPDLFEQRPIVTSFAMSRSAVADYEIKELLLRREMMRDEKTLEQGSLVPDRVNLDVLNLHFNTPSRSHLTPSLTRSLSKLDASSKLPFAGEQIAFADPIDTWSIDGYAQSIARKQQSLIASKWQHVSYLNRLRCQASAPTLLDNSSVVMLEQLGPGRLLWPLSTVKEDRRTFLDRCDAVNKIILGYNDRREAIQSFIDRFAFVTPRAVATDMPKWALPGIDYSTIPPEMLNENFDTTHAPAVKLQIAFPDASLLQYDCGKMQELAKLMQQCKYGSHRILIFTQMTKILDILEIWLNFNGFNYLRLDGSTKVEDRQALTEKFNRDDRIKAFILSTRSGGLGINLTGADMVLFWDLDWNYQIEAQCMDRAHRIGQTRDVHIYRFVSEHTIEENMLKKSQEKKLLDAMVIQDGQFTTEGLSKMSWIESMFDEGSRSIAGVRVGGRDDSGAHLQAGSANAALPNDRRIEMAMDAAEDEEDAQAAKTARAELHVMDDEFADEMGTRTADSVQQETKPMDGENSRMSEMPSPDSGQQPTDGDVRMEGEMEREEREEDNEDKDEDGGTVDDYMLRRVDVEWDFFSTI